MMSVLSRTVDSENKQQEKKDQMKKFRTVHYTIHTDKIKDARGVRFLALADLHGMRFGEGNQELLTQIERYEPQGILIAGDMIVRKDADSFVPAQQILQKLAARYPVYYALGNHEYTLYSADPQEHVLAKRYREYEKELKEAGVCFLHNADQEIVIGADRLRVYGLEIPRIYYKKPCFLKLLPEEITDLIGKPCSGVLNILLAHNPKYGDAYLNWGADLILSGHYHGGAIRLNRHTGVISPQFELFPDFCCGDFHRNGQHMLVSAGMGEHSIPVRIHNPRELLVVDLKPVPINGHLTR